MQRTGTRLFLKLAFLAVVFNYIPATVNAQYFGRNKPEYKKFRYDVYETPHFDIYHYLKNDSVLNQFARMSEEWYRRHYPVFGVDLKGHNPIFLYNNHGDFAQTTAISGAIGVGTGGVTEALKNRIVLPLAPMYAQTDHVLGHEMVHAFQYTTIIHGDSTNMSSLNNIPLWMVEGMAEYLSIGSVDEHTAMWIRDAVLHHDFPTFKDLDRDPKYFPYRWGQAFWAFVGKTWGDDKIVPLFIETSKVGFKDAIKNILGIDAETLQGMWKSATTLYYKPFLPDSVERLTGDKVAFPGNAGDLNVSPSVSPDGKYVVFLSEKDVLSLDLYLADVQRGKIVKKLSASLQHHEIDEMNNLESAGTWSPDGRYFAFTVYEKGKNQLVVIDVKKNRLTDQLNIPGVPSFFQPAWSPDGKSIVVVGQVNGVSNLFQYFLETEEVHKITNDRYSYVQPYWSHDGRYLVVATDRTPVPTDKPYLHTNLAMIDVKTGHVRVLSVFHGAENLNPLFSVDDQSVFFLSNRDGRRNLYRYDLKTGKVFRLTDYELGITGITHYSPAISIAREKNEIAYS
ncbi:MAG: tolB protein precursor, partial [Chlorobi bacterium]|nr:tolB protein precursor [Chlorobiota bacterium]